MERTPGTIIQALDRRYIVDNHGSWRLLDYQAKVQEQVAVVHEHDLPVEQSNRQGV